MAIKVGKGRSEVTITGALADGIERELRGILGPVADELDREADAILDRLEDEWPVKTGRSAEAWTKTLRVQPGSFEVDVAIANPFRYVRYIKSSKVGAKDDATRVRSPLTTLVRRPARAATKRLRDTLPPILAKHLQEVLDG